MKLGTQRQRLVVVVIATATLLMTALSGGASAQTDPYTGGGVNGGGVTVSATISLNDTDTMPGDPVRVSGCNFPANQFVRFTINPGTFQNPGAPCAGAPIPNQSALGEAAVERAAAGGAIVERLRFEPLGQVANSCRFANAGSAGAPDTAAGGGFASTRADGQGCVDTWITVPSKLSAGNYQVCASSTGLQTVCATLRLGGGTTNSRGLARTGLDLLPWVIGALLAIVVGRYLVKRSRRVAT
jgi:hypothetical protein